MKKIIILSLCSMILLCGCESKNKEATYEAKLGQIQELKKSELTIPEFSVDIEGKIDGALTNIDLSNVTLYDFVADVTVYDIDPDSEIYREKWTGVKLKDVLNTKGITEYDTLDFKSTGNITVRYKKEEINDNMYLIFYRNDMLISKSEDTPIMLFVSDLKNRYWVPSLTRMDIM